MNGSSNASGVVGRLRLNRSRNELDERRVAGLLALALSML